MIMQAKDLNQVLQEELASNGNFLALSCMFDGLSQKLRPFMVPGGYLFVANFVPAQPCEVYRRPVPSSYRLMARGTVENKTDNDAPRFHPCYNPSTGDEGDL